MAMITKGYRGTRPHSCGHGIDSGGVVAGGVRRQCPSKTGGLKKKGGSFMGGEPTEFGETVENLLLVECRTESKATDKLAAPHGALRDLTFS